MKKFLICILCLASIHGYSQFRLGVQGSFNSLNFWQTDGFTGLASGEYTWATNGWQAGVFGEYDLGYSGLEIVPALMYGTTGAHLGQSLGFASSRPNFVTGFSDTHLKINTLKLPINLVYSFRIDSKWKVFAGIGPYISKNLSGTENGWYKGYDNSTNTYTPGGGFIHNDIKLSSDPSYATVGKSNVAGFDVGMDILIGLQYKKLQLSAAWNRGFVREYHTSYVNMGNINWNFTLGYIIFGHERKPRL